MDGLSGDEGNLQTKVCESTVSYGVRDCCGISSHYLVLVVCPLYAPNIVEHVNEDSLLASIIGQESIVCGTSNEQPVLDIIRVFVLI